MWWNVHDTITRKDAAAAAAAGTGAGTGALVTVEDVARKISEEQESNLIAHNNRNPSHSRDHHHHRHRWMSPQHSGCPPSFRYFFSFDYRGINYNFYCSTFCKNFDTAKYRLLQLGLAPKNSSDKRPPRPPLLWRGTRAFWDQQHRHLSSSCGLWCANSSKGEELEIKAVEFPLWHSSQLLSNNILPHQGGSTIYPT